MNGVHDLITGVEAARKRPSFPPRRSVWRRAALVATVMSATGLACRDTADYALYERMTDRRAPETDGVSIGVGGANIRFVNTVMGLRNPESVRYDSTQDVYFISNMFGYGSVKDGNGYIVRVNAADLNRSTVFIKSGSAGVTLDAPNGMAISGDTLWVTDIDKLRGFHRVTGAPLATIDFAPAGAVLLNDVAVGANGEIRVTDTGIRMTEIGNYFVGPAHIYAVGPNATVRTVAGGAPAGQPNGIAWDGAHRRWIVVSFDQFRWDVSAIEGDSIYPLLTRAKQGKLDGVEVLPSGGILYSSWADSSLHLLDGGRDRQVIREVVAPADIGYDPRRQRVMIPLPTLGWMQIWTLAPAS